MSPWNICYQSCRLAAWLLTTGVMRMIPFEASVEKNVAHSDAEFIFALEDGFLACGRQGAP